jgi:riboflavin kinase / FMN adenylyltransferase
MKTYVQEWPGPINARVGFRSSVVTLGRFDGVHLGHQRVFSRMRQLASGRGLPLVLVTAGSHPPRLCSPGRQSQLLAEQGVDAVWRIPAIPELSQLDVGQLVRRVLVNHLHALHVVVGMDFRFGYQEVTPLGLARLGMKYRFTAEGVPLVVHSGTQVSSAAIRLKLAEGNVRGAARDLGRPHRVEGSAVRWYPPSQMFDVPRAGLQTRPHAAIPAHGAYAGWLSTIDSSRETGVSRWQAVISIGDWTLDERHHPVAVYVLDHDCPDVCGEDVAVDFIFRLRPPKQFLSIDSLARRIRKDAADARQLLMA